MDTIELQSVVARIQANKLSLDELRRFVKHPAGLLRINAVDAIAKFHFDDDATKLLVQAAEAEENALKLIGTETIAFFAIGKLLASNKTDRRNEGSRLLRQLPTDVRHELEEYLRSENICLPSVQE